MTVKNTSATIRKAKDSSVGDCLSNLHRSGGALWSAMSSFRKRSWHMSAAYLGPIFQGEIRGALSVVCAPTSTALQLSVFTMSCGQVKVATWGKEKITCSRQIVIPSGSRGLSVAAQQVSLHREQSPTGLFTWHACHKQQAPLNTINAKRISNLPTCHLQVIWIYYLQ